MIICDDVPQPLLSKMLVAGSNRRIFGVDSHAGIAITGVIADGRQIVHRAREEAQNYSETYGVKISPQVLANRIKLYVRHEFDSIDQEFEFTSGFIVGALLHNSWFAATVRIHCADRRV